MDIQIIQNKIYEIRGQRVMLDFDLAALYQVTTSALNQAVKRNIKRFPDDFMFHLSKGEFDNLKSQIVTSSWGGTRKPPYAFTEQGLAMLSGLLNSDVAIHVNIMIMRAFVQLRNMIVQSARYSAELAEFRSRLLLVEREVRENLEAMNDLSEDVRRDFDTVFEAIGALSVKLPEAKKSRQPIGFVTGNKED